MNSKVKKVLKFIWAQIVFIMWIEAIKLSFHLMTQPNTFYFYGGILMLLLLIVGPIIYYLDNIVMFLRNMKGIFFDKEKK